MGKRILFITSTRIGDAVLSTGLLAELLRENPDARVTVACGPAAAPAFEALPGLERIIVLEKMRYSLHWVSLWRRSVLRLWDILVDLRNAPLTYLIPALRHYRMGRADDGQHRMRLLARVLGRPEAMLRPSLWTSSAHEARAAELIPSGGPVLAIGPTANWRAKTWRQERFTDLTARLTGPGGIAAGARVAVFGHGSERDGVAEFIGSIPAERRIDLVGHTSLLEAYACLKRCRLYVGNDSGLMHMAAASGTPTLGLFGPSPDALYAPWGEHCAVVRGLGYRESFPADFDHRTSDTLMDSLSVDAVCDAAAALLEKVEGAAA